jgi:hypothetical protein
MKNKVLIYDSSNGFKRFVKMSFNNEIDCENFLEYRDRDCVDFEEFSAIFFIVNSPMDLLDLFMIYKNGGLVFLGSPVVKISQDLKALEDVVFLDLQQTRSEMVDFINYNLRIFKKEAKS